MTKARRRVARLALQLHVACTEPVFTGSTYFEQEAGLRQQWSELTPSRRKAARRQALRQISEAGGLERAVEQWVPRPRQQGSTGRNRPAYRLFNKCPAGRRVPSAECASADPSAVCPTKWRLNNCARCRGTRG